MPSVVMAVWPWLFDALERPVLLWLWVAAAPRPCWFFLPTENGKDIQLCVYSSVVHVQKDMFSFFFSFFVIDCSAWSSCDVCRLSRKVYAHTEPSYCCIVLTFFLSCVLLCSPLEYSLCCSLSRRYIGCVDVLVFSFSLFFFGFAFVSLLAASNGLSLFWVRVLTDDLNKSFLFFLTSWKRGDKQMSTSVISSFTYRLLCFSSV